MVIGQILKGTGAGEWRFSAPSSSPESLLETRTWSGKISGYDLKLAVGRGRYYNEILYYKVWETLAQVWQNECGLLIHEVVQDQAGRGSE